MDVVNAGAVGLAALDAAEAEILGALPQPSQADERERLAQAAALRIDYALNHHLTTRGRKLDFSEPWMRPLYEDRHPHRVIQKCVQVGISEYLVITTLADAAVGRTVFYVLPTFDVRNRFVSQRVDSPLMLVPEYRKRQYEAIGETDNKGLKAFGAGAMYFVSADTPRSFIEVSADTLIIDELDRCDPDNLTLAPDRLENAECPVTIEVANPTHPEFGISERYDASDMRLWMVRCRGCSEWQEIDFFTNALRVERDDAGEIKDFALLDEKWTPESERDIYCYCRKCGARINRLEDDAHRAAWLAQNPGRDIAGWRISHLMTARHTVREIYKEWTDAWGNPGKTARFINNVLGLAYSPAGSALTDAMLNACCMQGLRTAQRADGPCTMGVDVGSLWDVRISDQPEPGIRRMRFVGRMKAMEPVLDLIERYNVTSCVIDAKPEIELARRFQRAAQDRFRKGARQWLVWRCNFVADDTVRDAKKDEAEGVVSVNRTALFDAALEDIRLRRNVLPEDVATLLGGEYYRQMKVPKRQIEDTPSGTRVIWTKGVDHQRLADCYDKLADMVKPQQLLTSFYILG